ncbi:MAG: hydroxymethylbilane synthase [Campylobacter sp.]|nr:hydroxymethylbilane synthase [Campylobacter sp.]
MKTIKIATRKSALAMWQSEHIKARLEKSHPGLEVILVGMLSKGDVILDSPLAKIGGKGLFTKELEESMLKNESQIAVHSLKDVPVVFPDGLVLGAISSRDDVRDSFISEKFASFDELPKGAKVGTTSLRRRMQLLIKRPDLHIISLRGNVNTRLRKLKEGEFDAIILAKAGVNRLNLDKEIKYVLPFEVDEMIPAMGQGALGIECIKQDEILKILEVLKDENAMIETSIEREFAACLGGSCQVPIGVNAKISGDEICLNAIVGLPDGSEFIKDSTRVKLGTHNGLGKEFAQKFISQGALELLKQAELMAQNL